MMEITKHPWFVTCQFHPEFKSKPFLPHPLFVGFVRAALQMSATKSKEGKMKSIPIKKKSPFRAEARKGLAYLFPLILF
jgi:hypothetical protein